MNQCCESNCGCSKKGSGNIPAILIVCGVLGLLALLGSCGDKPIDPLDYDKSAMLANMGDQVIPGRYAQLQTSSEALLTQLNNLAGSTSVNETQVQEARDLLKAAWLDWQMASMFEFGPAETENLRSRLNIYPTDTAQILSNVASGSYDLNSAANADAIGFPAMDYLLNADDLTTTTAKLNNENSRLTLLRDLGNTLEASVSEVNQVWTNSYSASFKAADGNSAGSSISLLVNQLNFDLELAKNGQLGIPLGKKTLGQTLPQNVESYYGGYSSELIVAHLEGLHTAYLGTDLDGNAGDGLHDILSGLGAEYNGGLLADSIDFRFQRATSEARLLQDPLSVQVDADPAQANLVHSEIQRLIVLLKTDMASALGVLITYQDNDGD